ncbi:prephenate dehydrogenase [Streptomyces sp. NP160]|uniref:prephenate dehydrogenase n=1 Tax=Streptomyces sp. NP160 TaxID=2586637 RepID=UPI00111A8C71|nr:prephenate dehydrogenase [Streptomyces sp. NP160]TNM59332.1 prephenate dehydrogenase [Streptomyces sp. NP160]
MTTLHARTRGPVHVVGTGLLGTSAALALRARGVETTLADPSPTAAALARDLGAGRLRQPDDAPPVLVVVASPPDVTAAVVAEQLACWPDAVVTDVASVKLTVLSELRRLLADGAHGLAGAAGERALARYVGSHPLAGRERSGAVAARGTLFAGRPWVLCPTPSSSSTAVAAVRDLADDLGGVPVVMEAGDHDEAVALVSHVPQVAASLVAARLREAPEPAVELAGQGLRDVTRIAESDPALWVQILGANAGPVAAVLRDLRADLDAVLAALEQLADAGEDAQDRHDAAANSPGALAAVARLIADGGAGRARVPGKHGAPPTAYAVVTALVPDAPGELARLLHDVGAAGVNLEDLRIEHSPGQPVGLAEVSVLPAARTVLEAALRDLGWALLD